MVLRPEENVSRRQLHRQRLNWTKLVLSHHDSAWRQLFEFIDMRAESVENERPRTQERVRAAGLRSGDRSRDPELAATGIAADGSAKCYGRKLQKREGVTPSYFTRLVRLSYLAPDIAQAILDGRQPRYLTADKLLAHSRLPLAWHEQRSVLGFP